MDKHCKPRQANCELTVPCDVLFEISLSTAKWLGDTLAFIFIHFFFVS